MTQDYKCLKCGIQGMGECKHEINDSEDEYFCCWDEEENKPFELESIGINEYMCLGCYNKIELKGGKKGE